MLRTHLQGRINWNPINEIYIDHKKLSRYKFPSGNCRSIHLTTKNVKYKYDKILHIEDQVCNDQKCKLNENKSYFYVKHTKNYHEIKKHDPKKLEYLKKQIIIMINDFASTVEDKYDDLLNGNNDTIDLKNIKKYMTDYENIDEYQNTNKWKEVFEKWQPGWRECTSEELKCTLII